MLFTLLSYLLLLVLAQPYVFKLWFWLNQGALVLWLSPYRCPQKLNQITGMILQLFFSFTQSPRRPSLSLLLLHFRFTAKMKCPWHHAIHPYPGLSKFPKTFPFRRIRHRRHRNDSAESWSRHGFRVTSALASPTVPSIPRFRSNRSA